MIHACGEVNRSNYHGTSLTVHDQYEMVNGKKKGDQRSFILKFDTSIVNMPKCSQMAEENMPKKAFK